MIFREGTFIKANHNGKEVSGYILFDENSEAFITGNNKLKVAELSNIKISEAVSEEDIDEIVNNDLERLDANKVKNMKDKDVEKVSQAREKELTSAGVKIKKGDYADKLNAGMKALGVFSKVAKGDITMSDALKKYESTNKTDWSSFRESDLVAGSDQMFGDTETVDTTEDVSTKNALDSMSNTTSDLNDMPNTMDELNSDLNLDTDVDTSLGTNMDMDMDNLDDDLVSGFIDSSDEVTDDYLGSNGLSSSEENTLDKAITGNPLDSDLSGLVSDVSSIGEDDENDLSDMDLDFDSGLDSGLDSDLDDDFDDYSTDDIEIKIKNPKNSPIEIKIDSAVEDEINDEIDAELDDFESETPDFDEVGFLEHICRKYRINPRNRSIREARSLEEALCRVIEIVAANN